MRKYLAALGCIGIIALAIPASAHDSGTWAEYSEQEWGSPAANENDPCPECHVGENPHVPDAWWAGESKITIDKDSDVGDAFHVGDVVQNYEENTYDIFNVPRLNMGECENTTGPCFKVHKVDNSSVSWYMKEHGEHPSDYIIHLTVNVANGAADRAPICRLMGYSLGEHIFSGPGCLGKPFTLSDDFPTQNVFDIMNSQYGLLAGTQLP